MNYRFLVVVAFAIVAALPAPAIAQAPANDLATNATVIGSVPFVVQQDASESHTDGPGGCSNIGSVFFRFRPSTGMRLQADTFGSEYDTVLTVFRGRLGDLRLVACNDDAVGLDSAVRFRARAGVRYLIMIAACCGSRPGHGGPLEFALTEVPTTPLEATAEITSAVVDPIDGSINVEGTATCSQRAVASLSGRVRQLRDGLFVARGRIHVSATCDTSPTDWSTTVLPQGDVGFGTGDARFRYFVSAENGFEFFSSENEIVEVVPLT
jgi:hypothetical protein